MLYIILLAELYGHMSEMLLTYAFYRAIIKEKQERSSLCRDQ